jgi:hypothetical protein
MRLIELRQPDQHPFPLVVMAMADSEVCYHYRAARKDDTSDKADGLDIVFASEQVAGGERADGVTVEDLLAICEDRAKRQDVGNPSYRLVALQLQAARRALATDESDKVTNLVNTGSDSKRSSQANANALG